MKNNFSIKFCNSNINRITKVTTGNTFPNFYISSIIGESTKHRIEANKISQNSFYHRSIGMECIPIIISHQCS